MTHVRMFGLPVHRRRRASILAALVVFFCVCLADASDGTSCSAELAELKARNGQLEFVIANTCTQLSATAPSRSSEPFQRSAQLLYCERTALDSRCAPVLHADFMLARFAGC